MVKTAMFGATAVTPSAKNAAMNERMMSGLRPYRSASAPQNGRNGSPNRFASEVMTPTQKATSAAATPILGKYSGVNAESCP